MLLVALCLGFAAGGVWAAIDKPDVDKKLAAIANYDRGMSRDPLMAVEELVRDTQNRIELRKYIELELAKLLQSNTSLECKSFICRQLWQIGTADSVPAVAKLLLDEQTADMACYAIGQNQSPEAGKALRDALGKAPPKVQVRIINLLGDRRDGISECVRLLGERALGDERGVADAAITALGKIGGDQTRKILSEARAKGDPDLRLLATDAYLRCAEQLVAEGKKEQAIAIYKELAAAQSAGRLTAEPAIIRSAAVRGLAEVGGKDSAGLVVAALRDGDRTVRTVASGCVRTMQGEGVTELFAAEISRIPSDHQVLLLGALADRGDPNALPAVMAQAIPAGTIAAKSQNADVRKAAIDAVGKLGDATSVGFLVEVATKNDDAGEKAAALGSLARLRGNGVDEAIVKSMQKSQPEVRANLIEVLFERNAESAVGAILKEAASPDAKVRTAAFKALGRLANEKDLPALVKLLVDLPGESGRREAEKAVIAAGWHGLPAREDTARMAVPRRLKQTDVVLDALRSEKRPAVKCSLLRVLGGIANAPAMQAVRDGLKDSDSQVIDTAVRELANWPDAAATDVLLEIFKMDSRFRGNDITVQQQTHRILALRGLVRLLALPAPDSPRDSLRRDTGKMLQVWTQLLKDSRGPVEKKLVLSGLANVSDLKALQMIEPCLDDEAVKTEASLAVVKIAAGICGSHPDPSKAAVQKVLSIAKDDSIRKLAQEVINTIEKFEDYITSWQVCGPYMQEGKNYAALFDIAFPPETADAKEVKWIVMPAGTDPSRPFVLDLLKLYGGEQRVAYLRTCIHSDSRQQGRLEIGSDDGVKAWLNGTIVHANNVARPLTPGSDNVNVTLNQGWNLLMLKITQNNLPWEFCVRLRKPDGSSLPGIRIDCLHEPSG